MDDMYRILRAFVSLPVMEVQFNVVNRDLGVGVAGYNAFFNGLDWSTQDDIIGRTEQSLA